jgi:hypothetical protein
MDDDDEDFDGDDNDDSVDLASGSITSDHDSCKAAANHVEAAANASFSLGGSAGPPAHVLPQVAPCIQYHHHQKLHRDQQQLQQPPSSHRYRRYVVLNCIPQQVNIPTSAALS